LKARGWTIAAISRHTGRDRKTVARYLAGEGGRQNGKSAPSCLEPFRGYIEARFVDDPHLDATVLHRELVDAGFDSSYPTLVRKLRLELRPVCLVCEHRRGQQVTVKIDHPPGEEIQWDWLELHATPWERPAFLLLGALHRSPRPHLDHVVMTCLAGSGRISSWSIRTRKCRDKLAAKARSRESTPTSMLRSKAASVRFAEVTKAASSSATTAFACNTPSAPVGSSERGS
jgi:transposase